MVSDLSASTLAPRIRQGVHCTLWAMKITMIAALSIATAAALPLAAVANACGGDGDLPANYEFLTPSGNIVCDVYSDNLGAGCEIRDHTWVAPASTRGPNGR